MALRKFSSLLAVQVICTKPTCTVLMLQKYGI
jgi:hypothetical protein